MARRVIFLDIDGVLNHAGWREQQEIDRDTPQPPRGSESLDPSAVERLNQILERADAEVVLSSSWRLRGVERVQRALGARGFRGRLVDRTPLPPEHDDALFERLAGEPPAPGYIWPRGYEIQQWLDQNPDVEHILILDDSASMEHLMPWLVRTSLADGLRDRHVQEAVRVLQRPGPTRAKPGLETQTQLRHDMSMNELVAVVLAKLHTQSGDVPLYPRPAQGESGAPREWSTARWRGYLEALDRWWRWAQLGRAADSRGEFAEASACLAAAVWLQPESADSVFTRTLLKRSSSLPEILRQQFEPGFPSLPFRARHRRAWELGHELRGLPTLLRWSCDPRPWVRAQVYRSLGRLAHPAGIQALQEGSFDPHPQARAAAVNALLRCGDPTAFSRLRALAERETDKAVQRAARVAVQGIVAYWTHFGGWSDILSSPTRVLEFAEQLHEQGADDFAAQLLIHHATPRAHPRARALLVQLTRSQRDMAAPTDDYVPPPRLAPDDEGATYPDPVQAHADLGASGARGFEARRAFRFLGIGSTATRRTHEPAHIDVV